MQIQIDLKDMQDRLRVRKIVLDEQIEVENKKVLPETPANQDHADLAYDYEYRANQKSRLIKLENQLIEEDKALKRMEDGTYGICTNCGNEILPERLEALPHAELCINCQRLDQQLIRKEGNMLRSLNELLGYELMARDGGMGKVHDFFFNDEDWTIRYLIVDTGPWILGRKVLISPQALLQPIWTSETFPVNLDRQEVKESPEVDIAMPVSREYEEKLSNHYSWTNYWGVSSSMTPSAPARPLYFPPNIFKPHKDTKDESITSHLRSANELLKYEVQAKDSVIGLVKDFIVDDEEWQLIYMVVDIANWIKSEKQVLVSLEWISHIEVSSKEITMDLTQDAIKYSPPFDPTLPVNRQYEEVLYDYYGRPKYWQVIHEA